MHPTVAHVGLSTPVRRYGICNYACFAASASRAPGWRPSFRYYNKWLSLAGAVLCITVMFAMDLETALLSVLIGFGLCVTAPPRYGPSPDSRANLAAAVPQGFQLTAAR